MTAVTQQEQPIIPERLSDGLNQEHVQLREQIASIPVTDRARFIATIGPRAWHYETLLKREPLSAQADPDVQREVWDLANSTALQELDDRCPDGNWQPSKRPWDVAYEEAQRAILAERAEALRSAPKSRQSTIEERYSGDVAHERAVQIADASEVAPGWLAVQAGSIKLAEVRQAPQWISDAFNTVRNAQSTLDPGVVRRLDNAQRAMMQRYDPESNPNRLDLVTRARYQAWDTGWAVLRGENVPQAIPEVQSTSELKPRPGLRVALGVHAARLAFRAAQTRFMGVIAQPIAANTAHDISIYTAGNTIMQQVAEQVRQNVYAGLQAIVRDCKAGIEQEIFTPAAKELASPANVSVAAIEELLKPETTPSPELLSLVGDRVRKLNDQFVPAADVQLTRNRAILSWFDEDETNRRIGIQADIYAQNLLGVDLAQFRMHEPLHMRVAGLMAVKHAASQPGQAAPSIAL